MTAPSHLESRARIDRPGTHLLALVYLCAVGLCLLVMPDAMATGATVALLAMFGLFGFRTEARLLGVMTVITIVGILFKLNLAEVSAGVQLAGFLALLACALPFWLRPLGRTTDFPFVQLFSLILGIYVAVGVFLARTTSVLDQHLTDSQRERGLLFLAVFVVCIALGSAAIPRIAAFGTTTQASLSLRRAMVLIAVSYLGGFVIGQAGLATRLGNVGNAVTLLRTAGFLVIWWLWLRRDVRLWLALVVLGLVLIDVINGVGTTSLYAGLATPIAALCLYAAVRRRIPWAVVFGAVILALLFNSVKGDVRATTKREPSTADSSLTSRGVAFAGQSFTQSGLNTESISDAAGRFSYSSGDLLGYVSDVVPAQFPYWNKGTYKYLPLGVLPRAVAPWKPQATFGNEFGKTYDLIASDDEVTSANLPISVEAYVNFGFGGLVVAGLCAGLVFGLASRWVRLTKPGNYVLGAIVMGQFLAGVESDSTLMLGGMPLVLLVFIPLSRWLTTQPTTIESPARA